MSKDGFHKRSGTTDQGKEYENLLVAYYCIKLVLQQDIKDFKISSNDDKYGNFDDLVIEANFQDGSTQQFNIQAKHKQTNKNKKLLLESLAAEKGKFSVKKRFEEFSNEKSMLILLTNRVLDVKKDTELIRDANFVIYITHDETQLKFLDTSNGKQNAVYKFYLEEKRSEKIDNKRRQEIRRYRKFLSCFYLYTCQKNVNDIRAAISKLFQDHFKCDESTIRTYVDFVIKWSEHDGKKQKLSKEFIKIKIMESLLSPYIFAPSDRKETELSNLVKEAIDAFDVTIIPQANVTKDFYRINTDMVNLKNLNQTGIKYYMIPRFAKDFNAIPESKRGILLWLLNESALMVTVTELNQEVISHTIKFWGMFEAQKKFILIGTTKQLQNLTTFHSLSNLYNNHHNLYNKIVTTFKCSFQGQKEVTLEEIIDNNEEIQKSFTTNELTSMVDGSCNFGDPKEAIPDCYIDRKLTKITIDFSFIEKFADADVIVISCNSKLNFLQNHLHGTNYLVIDEVSDHLNSPSDSSMEFFSKYIYVANKQCSQDEYEKICEKNPRSACHHFQIDHNNHLEWLHSTNNIKNLRQFQTKSSHFIKEKNISDTYRLNVICADPGMGKSFMMSNLKNNYSSKVWVLKITLREHSIFFEKSSDHEKFLLKLFSKLSLPDFERQILNNFKDSKRLVLIWDGLDEISRDAFDNVLKAIDKFTRTGFIQWVTARSNLKTHLEDRFNVLSRRIKPLGKTDQEIYIKKRLGPRNLKDLGKITEEIVTKVDNEYLGVPLQIYMLTELYLHNEQACRFLLTNTLSIADLFGYIIEEKFRYYYKKADIDVSNNVAKQILEEHKKQRLDDYQNLALNLSLDSKVLGILKINGSGDFSQKIMEENDCFGLLDNTPNFPHKTYADYFVALWFSKNYNKISNLETFFFDERFRNIRFMFDLIMAKDCPAHVDVLYRNLEALESNIDKINLLDKVGRSPLHIASSWGENHPVIQTRHSGKKMIIVLDNGFEVKQNPNYQKTLDLLTKTCDINQKDELFQFDCLQYADRSHSLAALNSIGKYSEIDVTKFENYKDLSTILCYCIKYNYSNLFKMVKEVPYIETEEATTLLHLCAAYDRQKFLPKLLQNQMYKNDINRLDKKKWAPIHYAACFGNLEMVKNLKEMGADIHSGNNHGEPPLYVAAQFGQLEILKYLLENRANIDVYNSNGWTPLLIATQRLNFATIKFLVDHKADVNRTNRMGYSALYLAAHKGHLDIVNFLISKGATINITFKNGESSLYIAAKLGHLKVVKCLIQNKANVNATKTNGWTPLMIATRYGHLHVVKLLLENKASCNATNISSLLKSISRNGSLASPLDIAVEKGYLEITKLLLENGAVMNKQICFQRAVARGHLNVVQLLRKHGIQFQTGDEDLDKPLKKEPSNLGDSGILQKRKKILIIITLITSLIVLIISANIFWSKLRN